MKEKQTEIGVIIGRFQTHNLHQAHIDLINTVIDNHSKVILFLGTSSAINTKKNPLDFITRKAMIEEEFGFNISAILPLPDQRSDYVWTEQIHKKVREIYSSGDVTLYGSRDSFIPYYKGKWKTCELEPESYISATMLREDVSKKVIKSADFRAGIIYSVYSQYPIAFSTIDVAIIRGDEILLGRKENETDWRLIGGFVDPTDDSEIDACKREVNEETGLEVGDFKFICSKRVSDWRYSGIKDRAIMTHFYIAKYIFGSPQPNDDIVELKWFNLNHLKDFLSDSNIVKEHKSLLKEYFNDII